MTDTELDPQTAALAARLQAQFDSIAYEGAPPHMTRRGARIALAIGIPAVVAASVATVMVIGIGGTAPQPAWAAEPNPLNPQQEASAVAECKAATIIDDGLMNAAWTVDVFDSRGASTLTVLDTVVPDGVAHKRPGMHYRRACLSTFDDAGAPVLVEGGIGGDPDMSGLRFTTQGVNAWAAFGPLLPGAVRVELRVDGQPPVVASVDNDSFAAWWEESVTGHLVQLSSTGEILRSESIPPGGFERPVRGREPGGSNSSRGARGR